MEGEKTYHAYNEEVPGSQSPGFTPVYRRKGIKQLISTPDDSIQTVRDVIQQCKSKFGKQKGLGQIVVSTEKNQKGEQIEKRSLITYTYQEIVDQAETLGKALTSKKLYFEEPQRNMKLVGIYSKNRLEWFILDWACSLFGLTTVPLYDTLGKDNLQQCIKTTKMSTLFISDKTALGVVKFEVGGSLKTVVSFDKLHDEVIKKIKALGLELIYFKDLMTEGAKFNNNSNDIKVSPNDIYSFCYTSGTTGAAKGALITHRNMLAAMSAFILHKQLQFNSEDVYLSYLPLPHLMERTIANCIFFTGAFLVYSSIDLRNSSGNNAKIKEDTAFTKSTIFISVPRVYTKIVEEVKATISSKITDESKRLAITKEVYQNFRESFGGKIRIMASGSAPITSQVQQTMQNMMDCPLIEGYGQTEATCALIFSRATKTDFTVMHQLSPACEIKLCDIPEMKYTSQDVDKNNNLVPRGEIWVRGPQIFSGYYKREDLTKETIDAEGWVKTGDVGLITPNLGLKIIDRKKNIFKLQQGQYVAPDKVERIYLKTGLLNQVFLHGNSTQTFAVAIATPNPERLKKMAHNIGVEGKWQQICQSKQVRVIVLGFLNAFAKQYGILGFELAKNIHFEQEGFAGKKILTNTMKLVRYQARTCYKEEIQKMYKEGELKI